MLTILGTLFIVYASVSIAMLTYGNVDAGRVYFFHRSVGSLLRLRFIAASYPLAYVTKVCIGVLPRTCVKVLCHSQSH